MIFAFFLECEVNLLKIKDVYGVVIIVQVKMSVDEAVKEIYVIIKNNFWVNFMLQKVFI